MAIPTYPAWITGRKRFQGRMRSALPLIEREGGRVKVNALASWSAEQLGQYMAEHDFPRHPLEAQGYPYPRAGWARRSKTECGTRLPHAPAAARFAPASASSAFQAQL